ncbi:hypothetical protein Ancab_026562 [Ancistrocladus abbreviatus]
MLPAVGGSFGEVVGAECCITPSSKWDNVKEILGCCGLAAIQTQGCTSNHFGSTIVYGHVRPVQLKDLIADAARFQLKGWEA